MARPPTISIVCPVYKTEKYLRDCVESALAQTFTDFELILVDDGSPDKAGELCDELAKKDSRIRVFHQANGGVNSARRLGVEHACGEWICFVDTDDMLPKTALKDYLDVAIGDIDWIQGMSWNFRDGEALENGQLVRNDIREISDLADLVENMLTYHMGPAAKIVRRRLFTPNVLDIPRDIKFHEDALMNLRIIVNEPRGAKEIENAVYLYRERSSNSISSSSVLAESYVLRYARLMLLELRKISTPSNRERLLVALSRSLCGDIAYSVIGHGLPVKFPRRLAILMRRGMKAKRRYLFVYLCLCFNCLGIARFTARIFRVFRGEKMDAKDKTLLE